MLEAKNISKSFGDLKVLKNIDLDIQKGELTAIVGKSGSGKTTLLQIMGTLDVPDAGKIIINGEDVFGLNQKKIAAFRNKNIGFIYQFHHLLAEFTALENVMIPALIAKNTKANAESEAKKLLDYLGLGERLKHKPNQLSGGEQQRVAVARALINKPLVLFADEPTGNLDTATSEDMQQLFLQMKDDFDQTLVLVTHDENLAKICNRVLTMEDGIIL